MSVEEILAAWLGDTPCIVSRTEAGSNNLSYTVDTPTGRYLLRIYQNTANQARIQYEHALLSKLQEAALSFRVPAPVLALSGATFVRVEDARDAMAVLFLFLPGRFPREADPDDYRACGSALGELDKALAAIHIDAPAGVTRFGEFDRWHPAVTDPLEALKDLPLQREQQTRIEDVFGRIQEQVPDWYASLPQQLIHCDFDGSNILMEGERVTGVLDFEFSHVDLRALDLAVSVVGFGAAPWGPDSGNQLLEVLYAGYREGVQPSPAEIEALPDLMLLFRMVSLIHRAGRRLEGTSRTFDVMRRVDALLNLDGWLEVKRPELVRSLR